MITQQHDSYITVITDKLTTIIAAFAVTAFAWAPDLDGFNKLLTTISLLAGLVWIGLQIYFKFKEIRKEKHDPK